MQTLTLGDVTIQRVIEIARSSYATAKMLPTGIARHMSWIRPDFFDEATGDIVSRIQTGIEIYRGVTIPLKAESKWMSDDLYRRAASIDKEFHVVEGSNHMQLYDVPKYVDEAVSVLAPFFKSKL